MKIKSIEFENFRNFKERGTITCATDGKVTIIYGKNGDGKTTLHQLFQWIFYGNIHFNLTTTDKLYNLSFEQEQKLGSLFEVMGRIDFEHAGSNYSVTRTKTYKKGLDDSSVVKEDLQLQMLNENGDWKRVDKPSEALEKMLPVGLKEYFFFDGEGMIADLRTKGKDSAKKLKTALYSIFDLDVLDAAISHIGYEDTKTSVLGKLYLRKGTMSSDSEIAHAKTTYENHQNRLEQIRDNKAKINNEKKDKQSHVKQLSEKIARTSMTNEEYENKRNELSKSRDQFISNMDNALSDFGGEVVNEYIKLLLYKAVKNAKNKVESNFDENNCPPGLEKRLVTYLYNSNNGHCICGKPLDESSKEHLQHLLHFFQPYSNDAAYADFLRSANSIGESYDPDKLEDYIKRGLENRNAAEECDIKIKALDEEKKNSPDVSDIVALRGEAEDRIDEIDNELLPRLEQDELKYSLAMKKAKKEYDEKTSNTNIAKIVYHKMEIMEKVRDHFEKQLILESNRYSVQLQTNIQDLMNQMLTSKRTVNVSKDFAVRIIDSFNDESKSEGQFAVVSFAYIGGILKMLKDEQNLATKEYPLVLDGPFSKLDADQRKNVIECLSTFAPQVILFSKDDLQDSFNSDDIGHIWTISSNEEKNVAIVKEGYLWK